MIDYSLWRFFMLSEFKAFIMRGNVLDLAVGVIIGGAFTKIVTSVVNNLLSPLIGLFTRGINFKDLVWRPFGDLTFKYGAVLTDIIQFVVTGFVVFLIIKGINRIFQQNKADEAKANPELEVLNDIRDLLEKQNRAS